MSLSCKVLCVAWFKKEYVSEAGKIALNIIRQDALGDVSHDGSGLETVVREGGQVCKCKVHFIHSELCGNMTLFACHSTIQPY